MRSLFVLLLLSGSTFAQTNSTAWIGEPSGDWFELDNWTEGVPSENTTAQIRDGSANLFSPNGAFIDSLEIGVGLFTTDGTLRTVDSNLFVASDVIVGRSLLGPSTGLLDMTGDSALFGGNVTIGSAIQGFATGTAIVSGGVFRTTKAVPELIVGRIDGEGTATGRLQSGGPIGDAQFGFGLVSAGQLIGEGGLADGIIEAQSLFGSTRSVLLVGRNESSGAGHAIGALEVSGDVSGFATAQFGVNESKNGGTAEATVSIGGAYSVGSTTLGSPDGSGVASMLMQFGSKIVGNELLVNQGSEMIMWNSIDANYTNHGTASILGTPSANSNQPSRVNLSGPFNQSSTGVLEFDINGAQPGFGYEHIVVDEAVSMDGRVHLNFFNDFTPKEGHTFEFVQSLSRNGYTSRGISVSASNLSPNLAINVVEDGSLKLELVPPKPVAYVNNSGINPIWHDTKNWNLGQIPNSVNRISLVNEKPTDQSIAVTRPADVHDLIVGGVTNTMTLVVPSESTLNATSEIDINRNGLLSLSGDLIASKTNIRPGGAMFGEGRVTGDFENQGLVRIGVEKGPQQMTIDGDFSQLSRGWLEMDIFGSGDGEFDTLFVDGDLFLDGTLTLTLDDVKNIVPGVPIRLFSATGNITGNMTLQYPLLGNTLEFGFTTDDMGDIMLISSETGPGDLGDMNRDERVDQCDFDAFTLALRDIDTYMDIYSESPSTRGNINGDGEFDVDDIQPFFDLTNGVACKEEDVEAIPEPTSSMMIGIALVSGLLIRRKRTE